MRRISSRRLQPAEPSVIAPSVRSLYFLQCLLRKLGLNLRIVRVAQQSSLFEKHGIGVEGGPVRNHVAVEYRDLLLDRIFDDGTREIVLLRPDIDGTIRILEDQVDGLDLHRDQILHYIGMRLEEVVAHIGAIADIVAVLDRHDLGGACQHATDAVGERARDVRVPGDASIVATWEPSVLNNCTSLTSSLTSASAFISSGYCCEPSPGNAILAPLSCG